MGCIGYFVGLLATVIVGSRFVGEDGIGPLIFFALLVGGPVGVVIFKAVFDRGGTRLPAPADCPKCHGRGTYMLPGTSRGVWLTCNH